MAGRGLLANRLRANLSQPRRLQLQIQRDDALASIAVLDAKIAELADRRLAAVITADRLRDQLWPVVPGQRGRRPPPIGAAPLPPIQPNARPVCGRALRGTCLGILRRHGTLALTQIHALLHHYGYAVHSSFPAKALADALGHEADTGRAIRVRQGVYALGHPDHGDEQVRRR